MSEIIPQFPLSTLPAPPNTITAPQAFDIAHGFDVSRLVLMDTFFAMRCYATFPRTVGAGGAVPSAGQEVPDA